MIAEEIAEEWRSTNTKAIEGVIRQQFALRMKLRTSKEEQDEVSLAEKATAAYEDNSNGKYV